MLTIFAAFGAMVACLFYGLEVREDHGIGYAFPVWLVGLGFGWEAFWTMLEEFRQFRD